ncbi:hypothetical protein R1flu_007979 [Riccia fluitans]|uniref:Uncharacterized protein n=1 Tax=Riccia fluitans TaxID=41844 RepID=A0ABD1YE22_9MARC
MHRSRIALLVTQERHPVFNEQDITSPIVLLCGGLHDFLLSIFGTDTIHPSQLDEDVREETPAVRDEDPIDLHISHLDDLGGSHSYHVGGAVNRRTPRFPWGPSWNTLENGGSSMGWRRAGAS